MAASERKEDVQGSESPLQWSHSETGSWFEIESSTGSENSEFEETANGGQRGQGKDRAVELAPIPAVGQQTVPQVVVEDDAAEPQESGWSFIKIPLNYANGVKTARADLRAKLEERIADTIQRFVSTHVGMPAVVVSNVLLFTIGFLIGRRGGGVA